MDALKLFKSLALALVLGLQGGVVLANDSADLKKLTDSANAGNVKAQNELGDFYLNRAKSEFGFMLMGSETIPDVAKAVDWHTKSSQGRK